MTHTYIEPTASTAITTALGQQNNSFNALLKTFYNTSFPTSTNIKVAGSNIAAPDGMLYRNATNGVLYIVDSSAKKNSGSAIPGDWTRNGIGVRVFDTVTARNAVTDTFEMGELVLTLDNQRLTFANVATEGGTATFIDIGGDPTYSVVGSDVTIISDSLTVSDVYTDNIYVDDTIYHSSSTSYIGFNDSNAFLVSTNGVTRLAINGTGGASTFYGNLYIPEYVYHDGDSDTYLRFQNNNIQLFSGGNKGVEVTSSGNVGIGVTPTYRLDVQQTGNSILRVKSNSSGAGNDDDAAIILDSSEAGESYVGFRYSGVSKAKIEWFNVLNQVNILTEAGTNAAINIKPNNVSTVSVSENNIDISGTVSGDVLATNTEALSTSINDKLITPSNLQYALAKSANTYITHYDLQSGDVYRDFNNLGDYGSFDIVLTNVVRTSVSGVIYFQVYDVDTAAWVTTGYAMGAGNDAGENFTTNNSYFYQSHRPGYTDTDAGPYFGRVTIKNLSGYRPATARGNIARNGRLYDGIGFTPAISCSGIRIGVSAGSFVSGKIELLRN